MDTPDPMRASATRQPRTSVPLMVIITALIVTTFGGTLYYAAYKVAEISRKATDVMPAYQRCRDMAERLTDAREDISRLERAMAELQETNDYVPLSMWTQDHRARYETLWKERDDLAKKYNITASEYYETMHTHDMRFADEDTLPPDVSESLPLYFYPIYRQPLDQ